MIDHLWLGILGYMMPYIAFKSFIYNALIVVGNIMPYNLVTSFFIYTM